MNTRGATTPTISPPIAPPICIADIAPNLVALYASRAHGAHFVEKPPKLDHRIKEISDGKYEDDWARVMKMNERELTKACAELK